MNRTKIEYLDYTWNPIAMRCTPVSEGCRNCWHLAMAKRLAANPKIVNEFRNAYGGAIPPVLIHTELEAPLYLRKPSRIAIQLMGDLFHDSVPTEFVDMILATVSLSVFHTFLILTKRPARMKEYFDDSQTPFRIQRSADTVIVKRAMENIRYEIRPIPGFDKYFADTIGQIFTTNGSGHCVWCGKVFNTGQQDSLFCGQSCRSAACYARQQGRNSEPAGRIMRKVRTDRGEQGHLRINIIGGSKELVHRLVLTTFVRPPIGDEQGCHRDGNPEHNWVTNLRWGTQEDNWKDSKRHGTFNRHKTENNHIKPSIFWPLQNCFLGVSVEDQKTADERIPILLQIPAAHRWVSVEPMLGPVDLGLDKATCKCCPRWGSRWIRLKGQVTADFPFPLINDQYRKMIAPAGIYRAESNPHGALSVETPGGLLGVKPDEFEVFPKLDWVVCGGETGPGARPVHPDWVRSLRDQCQAAGVPFFFKSWGEWAPGSDHPHLVGHNRRTKIISPIDGRDNAVAKGAVTMVRTKHSGHLLDGKEWREFPTTAYLIKGGN